MAKPVLVLQENTKGRDFVVGDIHGVFSLLDQALAAVNFDPAVDRLISVGDLIDRGPESAECLRYLKQPWFFALRGNHEEAFIHLYQDRSVRNFERTVNMRNGMGWILKADLDTLDEIKAAVGKLPVAIEVHTKDGVYGFVHADVPAGMDWQTFTRLLNADDKRATNAAQWSRDRIENDDASGVPGATRVFLGHTPVPDGVRQLGNCFYMDTGGVFRVLYGKLAQPFFLTLADITASDADIKGPPAAGRDFKVAAGRPGPVAPKPVAPPKPPKP